MKKCAISIFITCLLLGAALAQDLSPREIEGYRARIAKLQTEIVRLTNKLAITKVSARKKEIADLIAVYRADIKRMEKLIEKKPEAGTLSPTPEAGVVTAVPEKEEALEVKKVEEPYKRFRFEIGGAAGFFGGTNAFLAEVRFPRMFVWGAATGSFRVSSGLAQSKDASRKYLPLNLDLIFNFPPGFMTGVENYLGLGLNYIVLTSGRKAGTIGAEAFYGVESDGFGGKVFGEVGYGGMRTGFSPDQSGITVMVGYRRSWGF